MIEVEWLEKKCLPNSNISLFSPIEIGADTDCARLELFKIIMKRCDIHTGDAADLSVDGSILDTLSK